MMLSPDNHASQGHNGIGSGADDPATASPSTAGLRVSQACHECRRKKVKCDGKTPCHNCTSRGKDCDYPGSRDNGSIGRQYAISLEARAQHMDSLCQRLEDLVDKLSKSAPQLHQSPQSLGPDRAHRDLVEAAQVLKSMPELRDSAGSHRSHTFDRRVSSDGTHDVEDTSDDDCLEDIPESMPHANTNHEGQNRAGALVRDSYGHLRFVGGTANSMLIEAAKSLSPAEAGTVSTTAREAPDNNDTSDPELPLFVRGNVWPELPYLPKPEQLSRPPQYVADLLIRLYFDQLHYTFPVLFKPHFIQRYKRLYRAGSSDTAAHDRRFLLVFFAVCACASSLFPSPSETHFPGIEYYEKALLLYYASTGEASLEKVQCLALLSMCSAGWNTLTQSWALAGQAVRAAFDIGLHLSSYLSVPSSNGTSSPDASHFLRQQISQRVWWCVYSLDRVTLVCLGRPVAAQDQDCYCKMPLDMNDEELEALAHQRTTKLHIGNPQTTALTSGFLAFAKLCRIAGRIQQLNSPRTIRTLSAGDPDKIQRFSNRVASHDQMLRVWLENLPDDVRFSANTAEWNLDGSPHLTMCLIMLMVHSGSLLSLYRCFIGSTRQTTLLADSADPVDAVSQCISAARSCINAAELVRDLVQPSHYLAICVHYLTLSGIMLLRIPSSHTDIHAIADVEKCVGFLKDLETRWSGARRSRAIIEHLLADHRSREAFSGSRTPGQEHSQGPNDGTKRTFSMFEADDTVNGADEGQFWNPMPGSDMFAFVGNMGIDQVTFPMWDNA